MIPLILTMALGFIGRSNAELALAHARSDRPPLSRYYASLAALEILPEARALGEGHSVSWAYLTDQSLQPILIEQMPTWGRIIRFDIVAGRMLWKAQLYPSSSESKCTMAEMLRRQRLGAAYKTGDRDQFDALMNHRGDILLYQLQPPTGTLIRTTFRLGQPEATESFRAGSSEALRRLGFP